MNKSIGGVVETDVNRPVFVGACDCGLGIEFAGFNNPGTAEVYFALCCCDGRGSGNEAKVHGGAEGWSKGKGLSIDSLYGWGEADGNAGNHAEMAVVVCGDNDGVVRPCRGDVRNRVAEDDV